ncbi:antitoxin [Lacticaseibacillus daqingensis]|uniref:antitoxin n=1 Tax=Lacticaseibacillus daqingensis TaxID=2486014 RepID=UPI000F7A8441|nr:antitoxin [Lacticaseibacillus daqingensis]
MAQEIHVLPLEPQLQAQLDQYCQAHAVTAEQVAVIALRSFLAQDNQGVAEMIGGYLDMGALNAAICREFTACESEAYAHMLTR